MSFVLLTLPLFVLAVTAEKTICGIPLLHALSHLESAPIKRTHYCATSKTHSSIVERFFCPTISARLDTEAHNPSKANDEALCLQRLDNNPLFILLVSTHTIIICTTTQGKQVKQQQ
jgi:hypothetical protein